jgi:hypothetical protein
MYAIKVDGMISSHGLLCNPEKIPFQPPLKLYIPNNVRGKTGTSKKGR